MEIKQEKNMRFLAKVGKMAELMLEGCNSSEIAEKLHLPESTTRVYMEKIHEITS
jgi:DNA-binding NarL/FixJ family response regulator